MKNTIKLGLSTAVTVEPSATGKGLTLTVKEGFLSLTREMTPDQAGALVAALEQACEAIGERAVFRVTP